MALSNKDIEMCTDLVHGVNVLQNDTHKETLKMACQCNVTRSEFPEMACRMPIWFHTDPALFDPETIMVCCVGQHEGLDCPFLVFGDKLAV